MDIKENVLYAESYSVLFGRETLFFFIQLFDIELRTLILFVRNYEMYEEFKLVYQSHNGNKRIAQCTQCTIYISSFFSTELLLYRHLHLLFTFSLSLSLILTHFLIYHLYVFRRAVSAQVALGVWVRYTRNKLSMLQ